MKQSWMIVRIVCALVVIFAMGVWVGRLTAPTPQGASLPEKESDAPEREWGSPEQRKRTVDMVSKRVIPHYQGSLQLSDEEVEELRPFFLHAGRQMWRSMPRTPRPGCGAVLGFHKRIAPFLDEEQKKRARQAGRGCAAAARGLVGAVRAGQTSRLGSRKVEGRKSFRRRRVRCPERSA